MSACGATACGTCVSVAAPNYCAWCQSCSDANTSFAQCKDWQSVKFLEDECPENSNFSISVGVAVALVALFFLWTLYRCYADRGQRAAKASAGMEAAYEKAKVVDVNFKEINLAAFAHPAGSFQEKFGSFSYYLGCIASLYYIWGLVTDSILFVSLYSDAHFDEAAFYAGCVCISVILIAYDVLRARAILKLDDVSDSFNNPDVVRVLSFNRKHHTFFSKLGSGIKCSDKMALLLYNSIISYPRLFFVEIPQAVIVIVASAKSKSALWQRCAQFAHMADASELICSLQPVCSQCMDDNYSVFGLVGNVVKGIFLAFALYKFFAAMFLYPCVRLAIQVRFASSGGSKYSLRGYCTFLIDYRITELLLKTPGCVPDDFWDKKGRPIEKTLSEKASEAKAAATQKIQETKAEYVADAQAVKAKAEERHAEFKADVAATKEKVQDKVASGKDAMKNALGKGKGMLGALSKREGESSNSPPASPVSSSQPSSPVSQASPAASPVAQEQPSPVNQPSPAAQSQPMVAIAVTA